MIDDEKWPRVNEKARWEKDGEYVAVAGAVDADRGSVYIVESSVAPRLPYAIRSLKTDGHDEDALASLVKRVGAWALENGFACVDLGGAR